MRKIFILFPILFLFFLFVFTFFQLKNLAQMTKSLAQDKEKLDFLLNEKKELLLKVNSEKSPSMEELMALLDFEKTKRIHFIKLWEIKIAEK